MKVCSVRIVAACACYRELGALLIVFDIRYIPLQHSSGPVHHFRLFCSNFSNMAPFVGGLLRISSTLIRFLQLLGSLAILAVFSYVLGILANGGQDIADWIRAVEGIAGAASLYALIAVFLTFCLGGVMLFAFLGIVLDVCFIGCFIAVAILTRGGTMQCSTITVQDLGNGDAGLGSNINSNYAPSVLRSCQLEQAVFILAIINV